MDNEHKDNPAEELRRRLRAELAARRDSLFTPIDCLLLMEFVEEEEYTEEELECMACRLYETFKNRKD